MTTNIAPFVDPDDLFAGLDGSEYLVDGETRCLEVYGVFDEGETRWVQFGIPGIAEPAVTIRVSTADTLSDVLDALKSWSDEEAVLS